jgi:hypothetical protein
MLEKIDKNTVGDLRLPSVRSVFTGSNIPSPVGLPRLKWRGGQGPVPFTASRSWIGRHIKADDLDRAKCDEILERVSACLVVLGVPNRID